MNVLDDVIKLVKEASLLMLSGYDEVESKGTEVNVVTDKDFAVQELLIEKLTQLIPNSAVIAEESDSYQEEDGYQWVIDPIDGTLNFAYDMKHSAISVALLKDKEAILGVCYDPYLDEVFWAEKGKGAYCNGMKLEVSDNPLKKALVMVGTSPYDKSLADHTFTIIKDLFLQARDIRRSGSAVLDLCYLASGRVDAFYEHQLSPWDYAAGALLVQEAGGVVNALDAEFGYSKPIGICAANKVVIDDIMGIIESNK